MDDGILIILGIALALFLVWARSRFADFGSQAPGDYANARSGRFDLRHHLDGPIECEGVIYGPLGRVTSRFEARFEARWTGDTGEMTEDFRYDDGTEQSRKWTLRIGPDGRIRATAEDVVGEGIGQQSGDAVQMRYRMRLPESAGSHVVDVVDWMYLTPGGTIVNRSQFRKFGIKVAELVATMRPAGPRRKRSAA